MGGGTRLDRLLSLLDTGSTPRTRRMAAQQIGEVVKYHPYDLQALLHRVYHYLRSKSWDTRVAAGAAIEAICENVNLWDPVEAQREVVATSKEEEQEGDAERVLCLSSFNVDRVLANGFPLLASGGKEFDTDWDDMDPKERVEAQKRQLRQRLGLDQFGTKDDFMNELVEDDDLVLKKDEEKRRREEEEAARRKGSEVIEEIDTKGMSARERNRAKRKARQMAKDQAAKSHRLASTVQPPSSPSQPTNKKMKTAITAQPGSSEKVVVEAVVDTQRAFLETNEWPFEPLCEELMHNLFDPLWEIRHGAGIGLRGVLKRHGSVAGKTMKTRSENQEAVNRQWLEDCAIRLICVLALDRFGDFVSDRVVAPVRETCAQALGAVLQHLPSESIHAVTGILLTLLERPQWEVRHGGTLGLKYVVAVRQDLIHTLLPHVLPAVTSGLQNRDDDVRAVSAEILLPVTALVASISAPQLPDLLTILWTTLLDLDDLTSSTSSVMNLLASFYSLESGTELLRTHVKAIGEDVMDTLDGSTRHPFAVLVPRLWPFLRHNIVSVRVAALKTMQKLLSPPSPADNAAWLTPILGDMMRHIFQNFLFEDREEVVEASQAVWTLLLQNVPAAKLSDITGPLLHDWFHLLCTPPGRQFDMKCILLAKHARPLELKHAKPTSAKVEARSQAPKEEKEKEKEKEKGEEKPPQNTELECHSADVYEATVQKRIVGARALGHLASMWPVKLQNVVYTIVMSLLASTWATQRQVGTLVLSEWRQSCDRDVNPPVPQVVHDALTAVLAEGAETPLFYSELDPALQKIREEAGIVISMFHSASMDKAQMVSIGSLASLSPETALHLAHDLCPMWVTSLQARTPLNATWTDQLETRRKRIMSTVGFFRLSQQNIHTSVLASVAEALVSTCVLPAKLNPTIRSLMNAVRGEENVTLQERAGRALARLLDLCQSRKPCPNDKVIRNVCASACDSRVPLMRADLSQVEHEAVLAKRGGETAICSIAKHFGETLFDSLSRLWELSCGTAMTVIRGGEATLPQDATTIQALVEALHVVGLLVLSVHSATHTRMLEVLDPIFVCLRSKSDLLRTAAARCLGRYCKTIQAATMERIIYDVVPMLSDTVNDESRLGGSEAMQNIIDELGIDIIPYVIFLVVPILGRMSDQNKKVRDTVTRCFAALVKLMPLEASFPDPVGMDIKLIERKKSERHFLEQLLDNTKADYYPIPIRIKGELRKYQQDGVNWLGFLNKFSLHGVLCDDMGLGKTLQAICIVAGDVYNRRHAHSERPLPENEPLPSLVVCPPTIVSHWYYEVLKFCDRADISPMMYTGPPSERTKLRREFKKHDLIILSYDVMRNDVEELVKNRYNYCILDEGHIIRNAKAKVTIAAKMLRANRRLILSGTPIQNNVLELWSLFDFLMPGFLGSERHFNEQYSKPILASRDPKCSRKDQEAGILAMEQLHRQVLPFLLRRLKGDVLADLPPKIIQDYYCELGPLQARLYNGFAREQIEKGLTHAVESEEEKMEEGEGEEEAEGEGTRTTKKARKGKKKVSGETQHIFQALQYLRKLCNHPLLVLQRDVPEHARVLKEMTADGSTESDIKHSPKLQSLKQLLHECGIGLKTESGSNGDELTEDAVGQHRVLIFVQMKSLLDIIERDLLKVHMPSVSYLRLDGGVEASRRHEIVMQFNQDPTIDILLLTTHVGGLGLNLTGADTVIFVEHDWNPMKDLQAMDRTHRIGQKKVVNVYRLITRGTLEEKIMGLQQFKLNIANTVVTRDNSSLQTMDTQQLLDLFTLSSEPPASAKREEGDTDEFGEARMKHKPKGLKAVLANLEELWDESQYTEEYDVTKFLTSLPPSHT